MVKVAVARSNNNRITLELLTARVCTRKVLALHTDGAIRYKSVIPCAASLARSAYLHYGNHVDLLRDTSRWETCRDGNLHAGDPTIYNPALQTTAKHKWAMKYNSQLMKRLRAHDKDRLRLKDSVLSLVLPGPASQVDAEDGDNPASEVWICCGVTRSQTMMLNLDSGKFMLSVALIASLYNHVESAGKNIKLKLHTQVLKPSGGMLRQRNEASLLCELRGRYKREAVSRDAAGVLADGDGEEEDMSGEDDEEVRQVGDLQNMSKDDEFKMLMGWEDELSNDDCEPGNVDDTCLDVCSEDEHMSEVESLNVKMAISAANQQPEADFEACTDRIAEDCDCLKSTSFSTLSPVEAETEAYLQEILLSRHHMHAEQGDDAPVPTSSAPPKDAVSDRRHDSFRPLFKPAASAVDDFRAAWRQCFQDACKALQHMHENSKRQPGDNGSLDAILCC
ncbi:unnamed protein product [Symbiodinium sp. CCMP2592]|nr:unnamed protein product [Symbiodinium sp. CCMP2592]